MSASCSGALTQTDKLYTGQQAEPADQALGLYNYKARFYSTTLGRFVSADNHGLNRFEYGNGNPVRYIDPSGECFVGPDGKELPCSADAAYSWIECAMGMHGCSGDLQKLAFLGIGQEGFWGNATRFAEGGCRCGGQASILKVSVLILMFQTTVTPGVVGTGALTAYGWETIGHWFGVDPPRFFMDSFNAIAYGSRELQLAGDDEIVGSSAWWMRWPTSNILWEVKRRFGIDTIGNSKLAYADWVNVTRDAALRLGDNHPWSDEQRVNLVGDVPGIKPPEEGSGKSIHQRIEECLKGLSLKCFDLRSVR